MTTFRFEKYPTVVLINVDNNDGTLTILTISYNLSDKNVFLKEVPIFKIFGSWLYISSSSILPVGGGSSGFSRSAFDAQKRAPRNLWIYRDG